MTHELTDTCDETAAYALTCATELRDQARAKADQFRVERDEALAREAAASRELVGVLARRVCDHAGRGGPCLTNDTVPRAKWCPSCANAFDGLVGSVNPTVL